MAAIEPLTVTTGPDASADSDQARDGDFFMAIGGDFLVAIDTS